MLLLDHTRIHNLTSAGAHRIMQIHMDCLLETCAVKRQAKALLIDAGRMVPADVVHVG